MKNKCDAFIELINENILPGIDFEALESSYETADKSYAKGILNHLHEAVVKAYGGDTLHPDYTGDMEDNFVVVPGVVQGKRTGQIALALLELDLSSSGEHWGTHFLCRHGVISQDGGNLPHDVIAPFVKSFVPYDYCYTVKIPNDIHIQHDKLPDGIKDMLNTFREHSAELLPPQRNCDANNSHTNDENEDDMER